MANKKNINLDKAIEQEEQKLADKKQAKKNKQYFKRFVKVVRELGLLLVVGSIAFSSYVVFFGVDSIISKVLLAPQILFGAIVLVKKFVK